MLSGFEEGGVIGSKSELATAVFPEFETVLDRAQESTSDYIHFIWDTEDICLFKNTTDTFGSLQSFSKKLNKSFPSIKSDSNFEMKFVIPFAAVREHLLLLTCQLDFFLLPFQDGVDLTDFIIPTRFFSGHQQTILNARAIKSVAKDDGWLTDEAIDFLTSW